MTTSVHVSIDVPDIERGLAFYGRVFGFLEKSRPFPTMAIVHGNNVTICIHEKAAGTRSSASSAEPRHYERHWTPVHLDFHVQDFEETLSRIGNESGVIENEFRNQGPMPVAFCSDPFGNGFCVIGELSSGE